MDIKNHTMHIIVEMLEAKEKKKINLNQQKYGRDHITFKKNPTIMFWYVFP